jgi:transposase-like protein
MLRSGVMIKSVFMGVFVCPPPPEVDRKILSLFSHGMSYQDIKYHIHDMYGIEVATGAITAIIDQLIPELEAWQQRPLNTVYPIVWMDAIHYKIR